MTVAAIYLLTNTSNDNVFVDNVVLAPNATKVVWNYTDAIKSAVDQGLLSAETLTDSDVPLSMPLADLELILRQLDQLPGPLDKDVVVDALSATP